MGTGRYKQLFESHDWAATPLGPMAVWPLHLRKSVEFMMDTPQPMFVLWGADKTFLFNEAFLPILGSRWPDALGESLPRLWRDVWPGLEPFAEAAMSGRGGLVDDVPLPTWASQYRETRYYTFSYTPVRGLGGEVVGAACICTDTTAKVLSASSAARERNALIRLFENAPGFIAMTEGPDHLFTFANVAYLSFVGVPDVVGRTVAEAMPEIAAQGFIDLLDQVYSTGEPFHARGVPIDVGRGDIRFANFVYEPVRNDEGAVVGLFCEGFDITEEKAALEKVQSLQTELIHVSRASAMGAMASTLAHELNQPLAAISSYASAAAKMFSHNPQSRDEVAQCLEGIRTAALKAGDIIRSVRSFTQRGSVSAEAANLETLVGEAANLALVGSGRTGIAVHYRLTPGLTVRADAIQIQQVVMNLLRNAVEAVEDSPVREITISTSASERGALVCVEDSGPGIDPARLPSLFEAFVTTKKDGLGMGLSISRTIVEAHGGAIWASNRKGGGASFCFVLPEAEEERQPRAA